MLEIGEIRKAKVLGYAGRGVKIYAPCEICGKPRWVNRRNYGKLKLCVACAAKERASRQVADKPDGRKMKRASELGIPYTKRDLCYFEDKCPVCGKQTWKLRRYFGTCCSKECMATLRSTKIRGENHPRWKGGRYQYKTGYIVIQLQPDDPFYPMTNKSGRVFEHRLVVAKALGRCLESWEIVHHKNKNRSDNRIENLELLPKQSEHIVLMQMEKRIKDLETQVAGLQGRITLLDAEIVQLRKGEVSDSWPEHTREINELERR